MSAISISLAVLLYLQCRRKVSYNQPSQITGNRQGSSDTRTTSIIDNYINIDNITPELSTVNLCPGTSSHNQNLIEGYTNYEMITKGDEETIPKQVTSPGHIDDDGIMIERDRSSDYTHLVNEMNGSETQVRIGK